MSRFNKILNFKFSKRHLAKTFSWRFIATSDTVLLSFFFSGNLLGGIKVGFFEIFTKMILYYIHERLWFKSSLRNKTVRHLIKTLSWRAIGTIDTILISLIIFGNIETALKIGFGETITKMILYFLHEKIWYRINFGLENRSSKISRLLVKTKIRKK
tara:strand:+ start:22 stop:492 length:471 start_codon:yes stop_codon:yes gene_type:complete